MNAADADRIDEQTLRRFPYPLVATYSRAFFQAPDAAEQHEYLLDLFEVTVKYCAALAMAQYFRDGVRDERVSRSLLDLRRPSLGHWLGWLRDILAVYRRSGRQLTVPELLPFTQSRQEQEVLEAVAGLRRLMASMSGQAAPPDPGAVSALQLLETLVTYRNHLAHGARPSAHDRERVAALLAPALRRLYASLDFIADYRLVYVRSVSLEFEGSEHRYRHVVTHLTGETPRMAPQPAVLEQPVPDKQLYVLDPTAEFRPLLSLHPFLVFSHCASCNKEQTFVLNAGDAQAPDYLGYQCTHHFRPTEYLDYMRRMLDDLGAGAGVVVPDPAVAAMEAPAPPTPGPAASSTAPPAGPPRATAPPPGPRSPVQHPPPRRVETQPRPQAAPRTAEPRRPASPFTWTPARAGAALAVVVVLLVVIRLAACGGSSSSSLLTAADLPAGYAPIDTAQAVPLATLLQTSLCGASAPVSPDSQSTAVFSSPAPTGVPGGFARLQDTVANFSGDGAASYLAAVRSAVGRCGGASPRSGATIGDDVYRYTSFVQETTYTVDLVRHGTTLVVVFAQRSSAISDASQDVDQAAAAQLNKLA